MQAGHVLYTSWWSHTSQGCDVLEHTDPDPWLRGDGHRGDGHRVDGHRGAQPKVWPIWQVWRRIASTECGGLCFPPLPGWYPEALVILCTHRRCQFTQEPKDEESHEHIHVLLP